MRSITDRLIKMTKAGKHLSRAYVRAKLKAVETRERRAPVHLQRVKDCLRRIVEHAASKNVRIALESRRGYEEIPSERELPSLLDDLNSGQVGYWHDFGHSQIKENWGLLMITPVVGRGRLQGFWLPRAGLRVAGQRP